LQHLVVSGARRGANRWPHAWLESWVYLLAEQIREKERETRYGIFRPLELRGSTSLRRKRILAP